MASPSGRRLWIDIDEEQWHGDKHLHPAVMKRVTPTTYEWGWEGYKMVSIAKHTELY